MKKHILKIISVILCMSLAFCLPASARSVGDVDGDKKITAADARKILRNSVGLETLDVYQFHQADFDKDGKITASDARAILRISVGLTPDGVVTGYDILRSGTFEVTFSVYEKGQKSEMTMAVTPTTTYVFSDEFPVGILMDAKYFYLIDHVEKGYLKYPYEEGSDSFPLGEFKAGESPFANLPPLYFADLVSEVTENGSVYKIYTFYISSGSTEIKFSGKELISISEKDSSGKVTAVSEFTYISSTVPPDKRGDFNGYQLAE